MSTINQFAEYFNLKIGGNSFVSEDHTFCFKEGNIKLQWHLVGFFFNGKRKAREVRREPRTYTNFST